MEKMSSNTAQCPWFGLDFNVSAPGHHSIILGGAHSSKKLCHIYWGGWVLNLLSSYELARAVLGITSDKAETDPLHSICYVDVGLK